MASYEAKAAFRLSKVDKVQVLLLEHSGTFAEMSNPVVTGRVFNISLIKYLAPIL
jgi:hypothetical protein